MQKNQIKEVKYRGFFFFNYKGHINLALISPIVAVFNLAWDFMSLACMYMFQTNGIWNKNEGIRLSTRSVMSMFCHQGNTLTIQSARVLNSSERLCPSMYMFQKQQLKMKALGCSQGHLNTSKVSCLWLICTNFRKTRLNIWMLRIFTRSNMGLFSYHRHIN